MSLKLSLFLFIAVFFVFSDVYGQECAEIRLDLAANSLALVPRSDQGTSNLCYAYAAAQLVDAYRASQNRLDQALAAEELAQKTMAAYPDRDGVYGGWIQDALKVAGSGSLYPEARLVSRAEDRMNSPDLLTTVQKLLSQQRPVAVNFCAEVVSWNNFTPSYEGFGSCARHYAVIVGQRRNVAGRCEFLVRDSLCSQYPLDKNKNPRCEQGQFWIESGALMANSDGLVWL